MPLTLLSQNLTLFLCFFLTSMRTKGSAKWPLGFVVLFLQEKWKFLKEICIIVKRIKIASFYTFYIAWFCRVLSCLIYFPLSILIGRNLWHMRDWIFRWRETHWRKCQSVQHHQDTGPDQLHRHTILDVEDWWPEDKGLQGTWMWQGNCKSTAPYPLLGSNSHKLWWTFHSILCMRELLFVLAFLQALYIASGFIYCVPTVLCLHMIGPR